MVFMRFRMVFMRFRMVFMRFRMVFMRFRMVFMCFRFFLASRCAESAPPVPPATDSYAPPHNLVRIAGLRSYFTGPVSLCTFLLKRIKIKPKEI
jgi:hypothetical protein